MPVDPREGRELCQMPQNSYLAPVNKPMGNTLYDVLQGTMVVTCIIMKTNYYPVQDDE